MIETMVKKLKEIMVWVDNTDDINWILILLIILILFVIRENWENIKR